ncbi:MAG: hypothetical protein II776_07180 [Clostridia bacterium]|nr:hypothetical protein [Clostridia bacterium]
MKKTVLKGLAVLLALLLAAFLAACAKKDETVPQGYLDAGTEGVEYRFFYPETWILDRHDAGMTSAYVSDADFSNVSITGFTASAQYPTLAAYAEEYYFAHFEDNFKNLAVEKNQDGTLKERVMTVDGCDALSVDYSASFDGETYSFRSYFISFNGSLYTVTYTARAEVFASHLELVEDMVSNLRFA